MYKVLLNFLNLITIGSVTTKIQVGVPELHRAEIKLLPPHMYTSECMQQVFPLISHCILSHLQEFLQIQQITGHFQVPQL